MTANTRNMRETVAVFSLLCITYIAYGYSAYDVVTNARTWVDEVTYIIKSWRYVTGSATPYSDQDPTWYMPLYFYQLGYWQTFVGAGIETARVHSVLIGGLSGLITFDIVRRITGNRIAAALSTLVLLTSPAVTFYFSSATPTATVSFLLALTTWVIANGLSAPRFWKSLTLGALVALLYFYRQNMILAAFALIPIHLLALRGQRLGHLAAVTLGLTTITALTLTFFPERLAVYAVRLPLITPFLASLNIISDPLLTIQSNTTSSMTLGTPLKSLAWQDVFDGFLLPYAGLIVCAGAVFVMARGSLKILWAAPLVFFFLSLTHYVGSLGYCTTCILPYTASYAMIGSICAGFAFALTWRSAKSEMLPPGLLTLIFCFVIVGLNLTVSGLATRPEYRFFPAAMLTNPRPIPETVSTQNLTEFIESNTDESQPILPIHGLSTIPLATFLADRAFPVQAINMRHSYRKLKANLTEDERVATLLALEKEGLWADETMEKWVTQTFETILFQIDPRDRNSSLLSQIEEKYDRTAETGFRGWNVYIYRKRGSGASNNAPNTVQQE